MSSEHTIITIKPFLIYNSQEFLTSWKTGIKGIDNIIKRKLEDFDENRIQSDVNFYLNFDGEDSLPKNKIVKSITLFDGKNYIFQCNKLLDEKRVIEFVNNIDPYDSGPDTWMGGDIGILSTDEISASQLKALSKKFKFEDQGGTLFELGMIVVNVTPFNAKIYEAIQKVLNKGEL
jgi:hypothetical protein